MVQRPHRLVVAAVTLVLIALAGLPVRADGWTLRLQGGVASPSETFHPPAGNPDPPRVTLDRASALSVALERRLTHRLGLEVGTLYTSPELAVVVDLSPTSSLRATDGLSVSPLWLGLDVHLRSGKPWDVYLGPQVAYVRYGEIALEFPGAPPSRFSFDDDVAWGAVLGVDRGSTRSAWSWGATVRYLTTTAVTGDLQLDVDPLVVNLGVGYRF